MTRPVSNLIRPAYTQSQVHLQASLLPPLKQRTVIPFKSVKSPGTRILLKYPTNPSAPNISSHLANLTGQLAYIQGPFGALTHRIQEMILVMTFAKP